MTTDPKSTPVQRAVNHYSNDYAGRLFINGGWLTVLIGVVFGLGAVVLVGWRRWFGDPMPTSLAWQVAIGGVVFAATGVFQGFLLIAVGRGLNYLRASAHLVAELLVETDRNNRST